MAGIMDEYDPPTPLNKFYCASRLNVEEYENQASSCTEKALLELMQHLEDNPESYHTVMTKRKKEVEDGGFLSYLKTKMWDLLYQEDKEHVSKDEYSKGLSKLKSDMVKVFNYAQESKGRRYSKRLAERKLKEHGSPTTAKSGDLNGPGGKCETSSIPPPPPLPSRVTPYAAISLSRRPLTDYNIKQLNNRHKICRSSQPACSNSLQDVLQELKDQGKIPLCSKVEKSPGGTPLSGWPKMKYDSNVGFFNMKLVDKFKNIPSPISPFSSPGSFESPVQSFADSPSS